MGKVNGDCNPHSCSERCHAWHSKHIHWCAESPHPLPLHQAPGRLRNAPFPPGRWQAPPKNLRCDRFISYDDDRRLRRLRSAARAHDAIKVCISLLQYQGQPSDADEVRQLSCRVLLGMASDAHIAGMLQKLRITKILQEVRSSGAVLAAKERHFKQFCALSMQLKLKIFSKVSSVPRGMAFAKVASNLGDDAMKKLERAQIVSSTKIQYSHNELLKIIADHLAKSGLLESAATLRREASLNVSTDEGSRWWCPQTMRSWPAFFLLRRRGKGSFDKVEKSFQGNTRKRKGRDDVADQVLSSPKPFKPFILGSAAAAAATASAPSKRVRTERLQHSASAEDSCQSESEERSLSIVLRRKQQGQGQGQGRRPRAMSRELPPSILEFEREKPRMVTSIPEAGAPGGSERGLVKGLKQARRHF